MARWAMKVTKSGNIGKRRYAVDHYWAGRHHNSVKDLDVALHYVDRSKAESMLKMVSGRDVKNPPAFKIVEIQITEVDEI